MSKHKLQVMLTPVMAKVLDDLMAATNKNIVETIYDALSTYNWCRRQVEEGYTIVASKPGVHEHRREPMLPFTKKE